MAKQAKSQVFSKATIYYDSDTQEWCIEEVDKDGSRIYSLARDVLAYWRDCEGVTISIKKEADYAPREED